MNTDLIKRVAKEAIFNALGDGTLISKYEAVKVMPEFVLPKATFVTLKQNGRLRGCIGSLVAHREFYDDLVHNAKSAAFNDPRFKPLTKEELPLTEIEISILTDAVLVHYENTLDLKSKITVAQDGVILKLGQNQATFLPQVWEDLQEFDTFFAHLCQKARLKPDCLCEHPQIYKYQVQKIK